MSGLLRFLAILLLALLARLLFSNWLRPKSGVSRDTKSNSKSKPVASMVKDPQCGTYVAPELAISAGHRGKTLHFCSNRCRDLYLKSLQ